MIRQCIHKIQILIIQTLLYIILSQLPNTLWIIIIHSIMKVVQTESLVIWFRSCSNALKLQLIKQPGFAHSLNLTLNRLTPTLLHLNYSRIAKKQPIF